jgi:mRNA-degrading endonuclease toxin of MazEF toxin-antitoxin module
MRSMNIFRCAAGNRRETVTRLSSPDRPGWVPVELVASDGDISGSVNASTLNTVLKSELRDKAGTLEESQMLAVDDAIMFALFGTAPR